MKEFSKDQKSILQTVFNHFGNNIQWPKSAISEIQFHSIGNYNALLDGIGNK